MLFAEDGVYAMQAAFDPNMAGAVPYTVLMAANDDVLYEQVGDLDTEKVGRAILANLPGHKGVSCDQPYWCAPSASPVNWGGGRFQRRARPGCFSRNSNKTKG
jgi:hypothetical protein